jgi:transaldolase
MTLCLDPTTVKEIREAASRGLSDGVKTIPSLVVKEGRNFHEALVEICQPVNGPVRAEVVSAEESAMVKEGRELGKIRIAKVPLIAEGLKATKRLVSEGIKVNVPLCFSPTQALLAAKAGAWCVSPFIGRLDDISSNGMESIRQIVTIHKTYDFKAFVLVARVCHPQHVAEAAVAISVPCPFRFSSNWSNTHWPI